MAFTDRDLAAARESQAQAQARLQEIRSEQATADVDQHRQLSREAAREHSTLLYASFVLTDDETGKG